MKQEHVEKLLNDRMKIRRVSKNEYITTEYMEEKKVYYVLSGSFLMMRTSKDGKNNVMDLKQAPQFLGIDKAVMPEEDYTFSDNLAKESCMVLEIDQG
ncbi:MAG: cyclic nucleotide-binding domain-containing protein, partial [Schaedlerella arabinosiphila]|nr:cyclic nucleotide-binding domain-containing protein [Schaedlerella arabinosiphila]